MEQLIKTYKVSTDVSNSIEAMEELIEFHALQLSNGDSNWKDRTRVVVGLDGDDFVRDKKTVQLTYTP